MWMICRQWLPHVCNPWTSTNPWVKGEKCFALCCETSVFVIVVKSSLYGTDTHPPLVSLLKSTCFVPKLTSVLLCFKMYQIIDLATIKVSDISLLIFIFSLAERFHINWELISHFIKTTVSFCMSHILSKLQTFYSKGNGGITSVGIWNSVSVLHPITFGIL